MEELIQSEEPRLVTTGQGFSFLNTVEYKGRFLYSKYNPTRAIESLIEKTTILPGTLIVIFSPLLWYGLESLKKKLPKECFIIAIEANSALELLARKELVKLNKTNEIKLYNLTNVSIIEKEINSLLLTSNIKRSLRIDFSAGIQFSKELYEWTDIAIQDIIATFWKNRITLVKFGKLFSKNLISNIKKLSSSYLIEDIEKIVEKPILVVGGGEGLNSINWEKINQNSFFIIAVDAALKPLLSYGIIPNAVVGMESQFAIQKAYTGTAWKIKDKNIIFFADTSSRSQIIDQLDTTTVFFSSLYSDGNFFNNLIAKEILNNFIKPMGSVGLVAVDIALKLRKNDSIEIYTVGLDFSYSVGFTHAKSTMAHIERLLKTKRNCSIENIDAAFATGAEFCSSKEGRKIVTTKLLSSYAKQFSTLFNNKINLYDASKTGINLGIQTKSIDNIQNDFSTCKITLPSLNTKRKIKIENFIEEEKEKLNELKSLLSEGENSKYFNNINLEKQIKEILLNREYLYLHFPDGYKLSLSQSFLKRVRAEIEYFLKLLK